MFDKLQNLHMYMFQCNYFQDWSIKYNKDEPVAPRYEINAPDLYIPGELHNVF